MNLFIRKLTLSIGMFIFINQAYAQITNEFSYANSKRESDQIFEVFSEYADRYLEILQQERTYPLLEVAWRQLINEQNSKKRKVMLTDFNNRFGNEIKSAIRQSGITSSAAVSGMSVNRNNTEVEFQSEYKTLVYKSEIDGESPVAPLNSTCRTISGEEILQMEFERENGPAEVNGCAQFDGGYSAVKQFATAQCGVEYNTRHLDYQVPATTGCDNRLMARGESVISIVAYAGLGPLNVMAGNLVKITKNNVPGAYMVHTGRMVNIMLLPFTSTESGLLNVSFSNQDFHSSVPVNTGEKFNFDYATVARVVGGRHELTDAKVSSTIKNSKSPRLITYVTP